MKDTARRRDTARRLSAAAVAFALAAIVLGAMLAPWVAPYDEQAIVAEPLARPSWAHPLGADRLGRDLLSRVLFGARLSLGGAVLALGIITTIGVVLGTVAGFYGRTIETLVMRLVDVVLAIPGLVLALAIAGLFPPGLFTVTAALAAVWWARYARVTRSLVLTYRERQFVEASRALGAGDVHVLGRHLAPHVLPPILALSALELGSLILAISGLSFLGLGVQPPRAEWGAMINDAKGVFLIAPHALLAPGAAVTLAVLAFNLAGEYIGSTMAVSPSLLAPSAGKPGSMPRGTAAGGDGEPVRD